MLEKINSPGDLKSLEYKDVAVLAEEIREMIIGQTTRAGGHLASNLGVVELTLALHRVFESPKDKIIWDVGHQCYPHKIITGRKEQFHTIRQKDGISGFPRMKESPHDAFDAGHASTSIAAALGYELGQRLQNKEGYVIACIGDGSLTGGMALEAMNLAGHLKNNLIVILNDNDMSISKNVGAISSRLTRLSSTRPYVRFRNFWSRFLNAIPFFGKRIYRLSERFKMGVKGALFKDRLFSDLGFRYIGPLNGHNVSQLERVLNNLKENPCGPVVVHVKTIKGKGLKEAEENPQNYHGVSPGNSNGPTMTSVFGDLLVKRAEENSSIVAITAAMDKGTGLVPFRDAFPDRFFDVGITESTAVTMAAAMSRTGLKPVVAIYSTFMQRAVDQVIHDVAINQLPVLFVMDRAGLVPQDGETHQGIFDIPLFRSIPSIEILAPVTEKDLHQSIDYGLAADHPVFIRIPKDQPLEDQGDAEEFLPGRGFFCKDYYAEKKPPMLVISLGGLMDEAREAIDIMSRQGLDGDLYQLRWAWPLDLEYLVDLSEQYDLVLFLEEGMEKGGVGETLAASLQERASGVSFLHKGVPQEFPPAASRKELFQITRLDSTSIAEDMMAIWERIRFEKVVDQVRKDNWKTRKI